MADVIDHHSDTLTVIFQQPVSRNTRWHDTLSLHLAVCTVEERHDGQC